MRDLRPGFSRDARARINYSSATKERQRPALCAQNHAAILFLDLCKNYRNVLQGEDKETQPNIPVRGSTNDTELSLDILI